MKQSDPLQLVKAGSLIPPGPIGRTVRLALGIVCLYALYQLIIFRWNIITTPVTVLPNLAVMTLAALCIINYVVNIGFGKNWGRLPGYVSVATMLILAGAGWLIFGSPDHPTLGIAYWFWLAYFYTHLGISFMVSAAIATPGCEMRAIPELIGKITGKSSFEHHCPVAFITKIDEWEQRLRTSNR